MDNANIPVKNTDSYLKKEIPFITIVVMLFYIMIYFFNYGFSDFYGYPKLFITINISSFFSPAFAIFCGVIFSLVTFRYFNESGKLRFYELALWAFLIFIALCMYIIRERDDYFYSNTKIIYILLFLSISMVVAFNTGISALYNIDYRDMRGITIFAFSLFAIPYCAGWVYAYSKTDIFYSNHMFLITKYDNAYVFGKCLKNQSSYQIITPDNDMKFSKLKQSEINQIKTCFRKSTE
ncbi:TPA: hypothetical protein MAR74_000681 [Klebsiella pneumoniae]|nr:hypothetical protein [Klebsiella pneumoniae]